MLTSQVSALVVEGTVRLAMDGRPVANARVQFAQESSQITHATTTGADGSYRFAYGLTQRCDYTIGFRCARDMKD